MIAFRLSNEAYAKIQRALEWPSNQDVSVGGYCKRVIERYAFRHEKIKAYCIGENTGCGHEDTPTYRGCGDCPYMSLLSPDERKVRK